MARTSAVLIALWICIYDLRTHRISNRALALLALPLIATAHSAPLIPTALAILVSFGLALLLEIGGGDFKLFSLLMITEGSLILSEDYLASFSLCLLLALLIALLTGRLRRHIAFAPVILAPFLYCYLAI